MTVTLLHGDALEVLRTLPDNSVDAIVTDPPAGISFMGKSWDTDHGGRDNWIAAFSEIARECLRVVKPGAHALVWAIPRTSHWTATAWEDGGWEVRERIAHVFGSGFPKSLDVSKQIDREEKGRWLKIIKAINGLDIGKLTTSWVNSKSANSAGLKFQKTEAGMNTLKSDSVHTGVVLQINRVSSDALAAIAELNSIEALHICGASCNSVQPPAAPNTVASNGHATIAVSQLESHEAALCMPDSSVLQSAWGWQSESTVDKLKAVEALKTWLGSKPFSKPAATDALCVALTDDLKRIILSQSKTFLNFDTTRQMDCASAMTATITEFTAENLISFTADTLRSKAIDKAAGAEREVIGMKRHARDGDVSHQAWTKNGTSAGADYATTPKTLGVGMETAPATDAAKLHAGKGTALKPAMEDWWLLRKPITGTIAANVLEWGTGGLNIDKCRVATNGETFARPVNHTGLHEGWDRPWRHDPDALASERLKRDESERKAVELGRWPAHLIHDGSDEVVAMFPQTTTHAGTYSRDKSNATNAGGVRFVGHREAGAIASSGDTGSAARFFYVAKASKRDRDEGLDGYYVCEDCHIMRHISELTSGCPNCGATMTPARNTHPTVKAVELCRYLCRLITPAGGVVLDPFCGSGSTGKGAVLEGFNFIGIEREADYIDIARARIAWAETQVRQLELGVAS